jgi:superfamily II DNA/RNA helicase
MLSATMPKEIRRLADKFLMNPKEITVNPESSTADTVEQSIMIVDQRDKRDALRKLMQSEDISNALIFCNRKRDIGVLHRSLVRHGFEAGALHGDMDQFSRTDTLKSFKDGNVKYLVCSDVAARGLDVAGMSHVFNFDVPTNAEDYVHRIGRTGRAGKSGCAITLATTEDGKYVAAIERMTGGPIPRRSVDGVVEANIDTSDDGKHRRRRGGRNSQSEGRGSERKASQGSERSDRKERTERPARKESERKESGQKEARQEKTGRKEAARPKRDDKPAPKKTQSPPPKRSSAQKQGFGDDVPAFMLRPVKIS